MSVKRKKDWNRVSVSEDKPTQPQEKLALGGSFPALRGRKSESKSITSIQESDTQNNLVAFFDLLLKIDMRQNPELYENND